jgi:hypothetical protein
VSTDGLVSTDEAASSDSPTLFDPFHGGSPNSIATSESGDPLCSQVDTVPDPDEVVLITGTGWGLPSWQHVSGARLRRNRTD